MAENLLNNAHKATNETYRENYDRIFVKKVKVLSAVGDEPVVLDVTYLNEHGRTKRERLEWPGAKPTEGKDGD